MDNSYDIGFIPKVLEVILEKDLSNGGSIKKKYKITVETSSKEQKDPVFVGSLHNVDWFGLFNCPDAHLGSQQRNMLEYEMQTGAGKAPVKEVLLCGQGLQFYDSNTPVFVLGDRILTSSKELPDICHIKQEYPLKCGKDYKDKYLYNKEAERYIQLVPSVTPVLFYGSLLGVLKPILASLNENADFIITVTGSKGHLKTSLVTLYALWLDTDIQKIDFMSSSKMQYIKDKISMLAGQNLLLDDLHDTTSSYKKNRMKDRLDTVTRIISNNINNTNVFVTGESIKDMAIVSTRDRMLEISMPKMDGKQLDLLKTNKDKLSGSFMAGLAVSFVTELIKKYDEVIMDIKKFLSLYKPLECLDGSTRIPSHIKYIQMTEFLYRKYFCDGDKNLSCKNDLDKTLEEQAKIQEKELLEQEAETAEDYVVVFNDIIENEEINLKTEKNLYYPGLDSALVYNNRIYITGMALQKAFSNHYKRVILQRVITNALHNAGILEEETDARTRKFGGIRHYVISIDMLKLYIENNK